MPLDVDAVALGTGPDTPGGDSLFTAFGKVNANTSKIAALLPGAYFGVVATRGLLCESIYTPHTQIMSVRHHRARDDIARLKLLLPNWYLDGLQEKAPGSAATITAAIEYPMGTFTQVRFSGAAQGTIPNGGMLMSDEVVVAIPFGAVFYVRLFYNNPSGIVFCRGNYGQIGNATWNTGLAGFQAEGVQSGSSGVTDRTMGGTVPFTDVGAAYSAVAILAQTSRPSVLAVGDSRVWGSSDIPDTTGDVGEVCRSIGPYLGYINAGLFSDQVRTFLNNSAQRKQLAQYCSHVISNLCGADLNSSSRSAAEIFADVKLMPALLGKTMGKTFFQCTTVPQASSNNGYTDYAGQTPNNTEDRRVPLCEMIRTLPGHIDLCDAVEYGRNSGRWLAPPMVPGPITPDGIHENQAGNLLYKRAGIIRPEMLTRA